jgi:hypothetical protein
MKASPAPPLSSPSPACRRLLVASARLDRPSDFGLDVLLGLLAAVAFFAIFDSPDEYAREA